MGEILFPPVGVAHLTDHPADLLRRRLAATSGQIDLACITQPKAEPHLGTAILLYATFAMAAELRESTGRRTTVILDVLENSPGYEWAVHDRRYFLPLNRVPRGCLSLAELGTRPLEELCRDLEQRSGVAYRLRSYAEIQGQRTFRSGLAQMLSNADLFGSILAPRDGRLLVRPLCNVCGTGDKRAHSVSWSSDQGSVIVTSECPIHGRFRVDLEDAGSVIDCNSPIRTVLRSYAFVDSDRSAGRLTAILNGADWAGEWMQHLYLGGLDALGVPVLRSPPNLFVPLILDESGAKLSKTLYLRAGAYDHLPYQWRSYAAFSDRYGERGHARLWEEVRGWVSEPRRFFRNYSLAYLESLLE